MRMGLGLGVALAAGCRDDGGGGSSGTLGYADFHWRCAGPGDVACAAGRVDGFPRTVALGSEFELGFVLVGVPSRVEAGWIELAGSSRAVLLSSTPGYGFGDDTVPDPTATLRADEVGSISLLALARDETVVDFVTLSIRPVTSLAVVLDCPDDACEGDGEVVDEGQAGTSVALRVEPYGDGELLVGTLEYEWSSLDPEVAELGGDPTGNPTGNRATLQLRREGTAYVRVRTGDVEDTVALTVTSNGPRRTRPDPGGGETETDTETEGDTEPTGTTGSGTDTDASTDAGTGTTTGGMQ